MATYAIGDIQGCLEPLCRLLDNVGFDRHRDHLWFTGDLVNRGPDSLGVLRLVHDLGERAVVVLGNHDLHLLALHVDPMRRPKKGDTLGEVLDAPDRDSLLDWLRRCPLMHRDTRLGYTLLHAGLPPEWDIDDAARHAREVEAVLRGPDFAAFFTSMYGNTPERWKPGLDAAERLRYLTNCFTRIRYCTPDGRLDLKTKGGLDTPAPGLLPWFMLPGRRSAGERIVFGHWSTLRLTLETQHRYNVYPLDTGAVWGGELSALRLDDGTRFSVPGLAGLAADTAGD